MFKYLAVSLLTIAFLVGFMLQAGAFQVKRIYETDPSTAYPKIEDNPNIDTAFDSNNNAAVYGDVLDQSLTNHLTTTSISGFWQ